MSASLRLTDFSDVEFLHLLDDAADPDGWATSTDIVQLPEMGWLRTDNPRARQCVAQRLSWLWRYGAVDREHLADEHGNLMYVAGDRKRPRWGQRWQLTDVGRAVVHGQLTQTHLRQLDALRGDPGRIVQLTRWLTEAARGDGVAGRMMTREFRYGTARERAA